MFKLAMLIFSLYIYFGGSTLCGAVDVFGIKQLLPSKAPLLEWNSLHWAKGGKRSIDTYDPMDTTGWSRKRGETSLMEIDGEGMLRMGGVQPRLYIMGTASKPLFFRDVEVTGYFRRVGTDGAFNGGFIVGVRSGPEGHGNDNCTANTYYLGFRYPGTWVFYKELFHPEGANGASGRIWPGAQILPVGKWIGLKYLAYNLSGQKTVKLEAYIDTISNGVPVQGGAWSKVAEIIDSGSWSVPVGNCGYPDNTIITQGGGAVLIRNTDAAEANYKMLSIREINPVGTVFIKSDFTTNTENIKANWRKVSNQVELLGVDGKSKISVIDLQGRLHGANTCSAQSSCFINLNSMDSKILVVFVNGKKLQLLNTIDVKEGQ